MDPVADVSASQAAVEAYMLNYFRALKTLEQAKDRFEEAAGNEQLPDSEQALAVAAYLDMTAAVAHLKSAHDRSLETYAGGATPPPADLVSKSLQLSRALADKIAAANTAVAVLEVTTQFLEDWTAILGGNAAATAAAPRKPNAEGNQAAVDYATRFKTERMVRATNMEFLGLGHR